MSKKTRLGKIFVSHSSVDKPFVRKLASAIERAGFAVWLDEKELMPGDPLARRIGEALDNARVVLVVVSAASIASRWLAFELNKASERMVKGECRVIPVVIERVELPPEVGGLLYADFTSDFKLPLKSVLTTLEHEAHQRQWSESFWSRAEMLAESTFGPKSYVSIGGEYKSVDYSALTLNARDEESGETSVHYEVISDYGRSAPLSESWWEEYTQAVSELGEKLFLVVTERPVGFKVQRLRGSPERISYRSIIGWRERVEGYVVFVDLSGLKKESEQRELLQESKRQLSEFERLVNP